MNFFKITAQKLYIQPTGIPLPVPESGMGSSSCKQSSQVLMAQSNGMIRKIYSKLFRNLIKVITQAEDKTVVAITTANHAVCPGLKSPRQ